MKYCVYCGHEIELKTTSCPYCHKDVSDNATTKVYHSNIKCIKCGSKDVNYEINTYKRDNIICEEEVYTCKNCGKKFNDKNRLGPSFNNNFQIILDNLSKKIIKWCIIIFIVSFVIINNIITTQKEEDSWVKIDCSGLPNMTFKEIKEGAPYSDDKYIGNNYIFTTTIREINGREIVTPIEEGDYTGSYITINKEELEKLANYKIGDTIKFCGTVKKISMYHKVYVKNATIID
jgi:hypothetical protein